MGVVAEKGVITTPGATGNQTYNLGSAFDGIAPKFLLLWATFQTAHGIENADGIFSFGCGTYDASSVQQWFFTGFNQDATAAQVTAHGSDTTAILRGQTGDDTTLDYEIDLVSFSSGTPSNFVLNWVALPASAILIHYLVVGGTSITAARAGGFTISTAVATQDVTVAASWGQPDFVMFGGHAYTSTTARNDARYTLAAAKNDTERTATLISFEDAGATMALASWTKDRAGLFLGSGVTADAEFDLSAKGSWPSDGFQLSFTDQASFAFLHKFLALKVAADCDIRLGRTTIPTSGAPNTQTVVTTSGTPKAALFWGTGIPANAGIDTTHAGLGQWIVGGTDGTNEGFAGVAQDDANTDSRAGRFSSDTKAFARHLADAAGGAPTLDAEADIAFSGADVQLVWNDVAGAAAEYSYLVFAEIPAGLPRPPVAVLQAVNRAAVI